MIITHTKKEMKKIRLVYKISQNFRKMQVFGTVGVSRKLQTKGENIPLTINFKNVYKYIRFC